MRRVAVIDIGKSNAKCVLVDPETGVELAERRLANRPLPGPPFPHHDVDRLWLFVLQSLAAFRSGHTVDAVSVATHGATAALLRSDGELALPVLDYEHGALDDLRDRYDAIRPGFGETGSPPLPMGLNLGAQLHWLSNTFPDRFALTARILCYPQYWAWRLSGVLANEPTSLGCHTDLWNPHAADYSSLVDSQGWRSLFAPVRPASACLGPVTAEVAGATGLDPETPVYCGIHDSNASLLPHLLGRTAPFAVVSTGTWVVCMAVGPANADLDPARDTLINVDAMGRPVPSARFMGGREFELAGAGDGAVSPVFVDAVLDDLIMLMPSIVPGSGPFPDMSARWTADPDCVEARTVAVSFYLALMTSTCLEMIGADGPVIVEGAFAHNLPYMQMLGAAAGRPVLAGASRATGTSIGAALLAQPDGSLPVNQPMQAIARSVDPRLATYAGAWRAAVRDRNQIGGALR